MQYLRPLANIGGLVCTEGLGVLSSQMEHGTYVFLDPQTGRLLQLIIATGPLLLLLLMRMVLGRSKELMLAVWLSVGWFAMRASLNPSMSFIQDYARPIERLLQG